MVRLFLVKNIQIINWGTLQTRRLVLTNAGRLEQIQKTENIWQILCQDLEKDDLRHDRALNPCERMKSLTWDLLSKESKDTNVSSVSQSDLMGKSLMRTQAWLEKNHLCSPSRVLKSIQFSDQNWMVWDVTASGYPHQILRRLLVWEEGTE